VHTVTGFAAITCTVSRVLGSGVIAGHDARRTSYPFPHRIAAVAKGARLELDVHGRAIDHDVVMLAARVPVARRAPGRGWRPRRRPCRRTRRCISDPSVRGLAEQHAPGLLVRRGAQVGGRVDRGGFA